MGKEKTGLEKKEGKAGTSDGKEGRTRMDRKGTERAGEGSPTAGARGQGPIREGCVIEVERGVC